MPWKRIAFFTLLAAEIAVLCLVAFLGKTGAVDGLVVRKGTASIDIANQSGPWGVLVVKQVVAPVPSWVVVRATQASALGAVLGVVRVPAGTSADLSISLDPAQGLVNLFDVSLVADRGRPAVFEPAATASAGGGGGMGGMGGGSSSAKGVAASSVAATQAPDKPFISGGKLVDVVVRETYRNGSPGFVQRVVER
jgi:hypothetical protein